MVQAVFSKHLLSAAFNSRSGMIHFGAVALDRKGRVLSAGWNGRPAERDEEAAKGILALLSKPAEERGITLTLSSLIPGRGFRKSVHAEGRTLINLVKETGRTEDIFRIDRIQIAAFLPNNKYFGIKKVEPDATEVWATCKSCARIIDLSGAHGEILTTNGWMSVNPKRAFESATAERIVPLSFWDQETKTVKAAIKASAEKYPPLVETEFMRWQRLEL